MTSWTPSCQYQIDRLGDRASNSSNLSTRLATADIFTFLKEKSIITDKTLLIPDDQFVLLLLHRDIVLGHRSVGKKDTAAGRLASPEVVECQISWARGAKKGYLSKLPKRLPKLQGKKSCTTAAGEKIAAPWLQGWKNASNCFKMLLNASKMLLLGQNLAISWTFVN